MMPIDHQSEEESGRPALDTTSGGLEQVFDGRGNLVEIKLHCLLQHDVKVIRCVDHILQVDDAEVVHLIE